MNYHQTAPPGKRAGHEKPENVPEKPTKEVHMKFNDKAPLYVVSDLHIGDHGARDNFTRIDLTTESGEQVSRPEQFRLFLDLVRKDGGNLLVIGDMFELWQANVGDVLAKNIRLLDELAAIENILIILGNHDMDLLGLVSCAELGLRNAHPIFAKIYVPGKECPGDKKIFTLKFGALTYGFIHGNEIDNFNNSAAPGIGRAITILAGIIEDSVGGPFLPESGKLVEEDLLDKVGLLKLSPLKVLWKIFASRKIVYTLFLFFLWAASLLLLGYSVAVNQLYTNISFFFAFLGAIFLPSVGLFVFGRHIYQVVVAATVKAGGSMLEYLTLWRSKLPDSQTSMSNKDEDVACRDRSLLEELKQDNGCDILVMGHTHVDDIQGWLCNSGTWANAKPSYLKLSPDGVIELYRWQALDSAGGKGVLRKRFDTAKQEISQIEPFNNQRS